MQRIGDILPKKIENPLREGLPSKIYLLAYGEPLTAYEMSKRIYGIKPPQMGERAQIPPTSKVTNWVKEMKSKGILSENEKRKNFSKSEPLQDEIAKTLKDQNVELSDLERYMINAILDSQEFRLTVKAIDFPLGHHDGPIWVPHDIDSAWLMMNTLAPFATSVSLRQKAKGEPSQPKTPKEFDKKLNTIRRFWESKEFKMDMQSLKEELSNQMKTNGRSTTFPDEIILSVIKLSVILYLIPTSTLEKLVNLSFINRLTLILVSGGLELFQLSRLEKIWRKEVERMNTRTEKKRSKVPDWKKRRAR
jgi:hypothetical protein